MEQVQIERVIKLFNDTYVDDVHVPVVEHWIMYDGFYAGCTLRQVGYNYKILFYPRYAVKELVDTSVYSDAFYDKWEDLECDLKNEEFSVDDVKEMIYSYLHDLKMEIKRITDKLNVISCKIEESGI